MSGIDRFLWLLLAGVGGVAAILGWLMTLGSLLLWLMPVVGDDVPVPRFQRLWQQIRLTGISLAIALLGSAILVVLSRISLN